jgi:hypothetical protein
VIGWSYSLGCVRSRLYQSRQTMSSFVKDGDNHVFAQGNKATLMKDNRNIEQRGPLGNTLPRKTTTTLPVVAQQWCPFRINIYYHKSDGYYYLSTKRALFVHITIMQDTRLFSVAGLTWTSMLRKW